MPTVEELSLRALVVFVLASCASSGGGDALDPSTFAKWKANEPRDYVAQVCTMNIEPPGCQRALIADGEIVSTAERIYGYDGADYGWEELRDEDREEVKSPLDWMFTEAAGDDEEGCAIADIRYEDDYGYQSSADPRRS